MPERDFWRTMNPARLHTLFNAWFRPARQGPAPEQARQPRQSLSEYLRGGG